MLELVFFTGSKIKLSHAKYLMKDFSVKVVGIQEKSYNASYYEPRILDRKQLLDDSYYSAIEQAKKARLNLDVPFILEDTSVNIYALTSKYKKETPGLDVKYWMKEMSFESLDSELKGLGNNRAVEVRSDLIVHIPNRLREKYEVDYLHFVGKKYGRVVNKEGEFSTQSLYPWLDNKTFNKWFVPDGESLPISMLDIDTADRHDFRRSCFSQLIMFLQKEGFFHLDRANYEGTTPELGFSKNFVIVGLQCAGKTTLAQFLCDKFDYFHIEASDFMHLLYREKHLPTSDVKIGRFAAELLENDPVAISRMVVDFIEDNGCLPFIVTGFRKKEEVDCLVQCLGHLKVDAIFIDSSYRARLERFYSRGRQQNEEFSIRDSRENSMGLQQLRNSLPVFVNESSLDDFLEGFSKCYKVDIGSDIYSFKGGRDLFRKILLALESEWVDEVYTPYLTTTEISKKINLLLDNNEKKKHKDNVSRFFNQKDSVFFEQKLENGKKRYRLSNTGYSFAVLLKMKSLSGLH